MLPSILAGQLQQGLSDYVRTTFPITNPVFQGSIENLLATEDSIFREPYVAVRMPFRIAGDVPDMFESIHPQYKPYVHQQRAFERLTGEDGRSTIIATGTGSGKTECFFYPILEYCYKHRGEKGIKALIIYPMNALATDQAKRMAELIHNSPELHGNVTAGMYVGGFESHPSHAMSEDQIITDRETMLSNPPDILLTNYKMLDYLLVRPKDATLWLDNKPETLKYIAVDELHTFDGAQGTDLACLLRRLKARLFTPPGYLCCIGTSATLGAKSSAARILEYGSTVFGELFEDDAIITEDRLSPSEFLDGREVTDFTIPSQKDIEALLVYRDDDNQIAYLNTAAEAWFDNTLALSDIMTDEARIALGQRLMSHSFTHGLLSYMGGNYVQISYVCDELMPRYPELAEIRNKSVALDALLALISHARLGEPGKLRPFLTVQVQLWMRELRRLLGRVTSENVNYALAPDLNDQQAKQYLPVVNCRDCGETGWVSLVNELGKVALSDLNTFYNLYFKTDSKVIFLFPYGDDPVPKNLVKTRLCPECMQLQLEDREECACGASTIPIAYPNPIRTYGDKENKHYICPFCGSKSGLSIMGLRSATAISASISQLFASKFNDDKKTLAFSDNVQDAAHRAGFFNARTWRFGLRSAIQRFALEEGEGLSLAEFADRFIEYWHKNLSEEEFVGLFVAPNMQWMRAYEKLRTENKLAQTRDAKKLVTDIEYRLRYEIMLEYGMYSRIGRTLEKSGCSVLAFEPETVAAMALITKERCMNELGCLHIVDHIAFQRMIIGWLHFLRSNGAFNDRIFGAYTYNSGKQYLLSNNQEKWLPGLYPGRNTPRFLYEMQNNGRHINDFDLVAQAKYDDWIQACIDDFMVGEDLSVQVGKIVLQELIKSKLLVNMPAPAGYQIWGLDKNKVTISTEVKQFSCDKCGNMISAAAENGDVWEDAPCSRGKCDGHLHQVMDSSLDYYNRLYSTGDMVRIVAKEHTGLLERDDREGLERIFKRGIEEKMPWDANVLSCTPTLEMGIDIGDLSTIILCNIPPAEAQFLQRTGRAGRTDGNSLTIAVANARPHDLYFYAEPMEMLSGVVEPPKVFLRASAVLERQFIAYCMDCWVKQGVAETAIPRMVGICLTKLEQRPKDMYPFNFLNYVQNNLSRLWRTFIEMFTPYLDKATDEQIKKFVHGEGLDDSPMHMKVYEAFASLKKQRDAVKQSIKDLKEMIEEIKKKPADISYEEEMKELNREKRALGHVVQSITNRDVFNFLSEEGLLPNYAFPEAGIMLKAVLYRKDDSVSDIPDLVKKRKYEKMVYQYNRSASSAISEFAPLNSFYVDGRKLTVDQVDLNTAQAALWRLCPNCSHAQLEEAGKAVAYCPQCGTNAWADSGQVRNMLKVQMVYSNMDYTKSFISDDSDDRSSRFYCKQMLVDVNEEQDISKAYRMDNDDFAFGYEFVKKATMREINFGESDNVGERLMVSGVDEVRKGFKICKFCGKIQPDRGEPQHTYVCKAKRGLAGAGPFEECLFLYREFVTEALRLLVPATTMESSKVRQESFIAAFMLGMREYFGNVDHLRACLIEVPVSDADYRKEYLVIYDSIPGGTGYLKQLMMQGDSLIEIFAKALNILENCGCKDDPQKDGCYHCLYAYRQSNKIGQISRSTAIQLLRSILSGKDNIQEIPKLAAIPVNSLFESELERKFVEALNQKCNKSGKLPISKALVNNKEGYILKTGDCLWEVEPQVWLNHEYGINVQSRADFVLWPARKNTGQKPVAVFTDGFTFHKDIVADDTLKRHAILQSNKFRVWSLSWKDVQSVFQAQGDYALATLTPQDMPSGRIFYKQTVESGNAGILQPVSDSPFELLVRYLENPNAEELFTVHGTAYALSLLDRNNLNNSEAFAEWAHIIHPIIETLALRDSGFEIDDTLFGLWRPGSDSDLTILAGVASSDLKLSKTNAPISVCALLNDHKDTRTDKYEASWNGLWHFYNMMQFLPIFAAVSTSGMKDGIYNELGLGYLDDTAPLESVYISDASWDDVMQQIFDKGARECAMKLVEAGVSPPSAVGYELENTDGAVIAECEMAWEERKIALILPDQTESKSRFEANGWTVMLIDESFTVAEFQGGTNNE